MHATYNNSLSFGWCSIDSGFLLACCECGEQWFLTTKLQVWDLKTIMDSSTSSQIIQPLIDISVCPLPFIRSVSTMSLHVIRHNRFLQLFDVMCLIVSFLSMVSVWYTGYRLCEWSLLLALREVILRYPHN